MKAHLLMPALDPEESGARVLQYHVEPGDTVHRGDMFAWIETNKGAIEIEAYAEGTVREILVEEGETVPFDEPLVTLEAPD